MSIPLHTNEYEIQAVILGAIIDSEPLTLVHRNARTDAVTSRTVVPYALERCKNGQVLMRCDDLTNKGTRGFRLSGIIAIGPAWETATPAVQVIVVL